MGLDYYLSSLQNLIVKYLAITPSMGIYQNCSAPSHALLYSMLVSSILISVSGVWFYKKYLSGK